MTEEVRDGRPGTPFSGLVFKIQSDPHVGKLAYRPRLLGHARVRVSYALNTTKGDRERIGRLLRMHANHREEIESVGAGDIVRHHRPQGHRSPVTRSAIRPTRSSSNRSTSPSR